MSSPVSAHSWKLRSDWTSSNPILPLNYGAYEVDTLVYKIGNGVSHWNALTYVTSTLTESEEGIYLTTADLAPYVTSASVVSYTSGFITSASVSSMLDPYLTSSSAASTYLTISSGNVSFAADTFGITIDGLGSVLSSGSKGFITLVKSHGTITNWYLAADVSGTCGFDIKKSGASLIGTGNAPTLGGHQFINASVSGWTSTDLSIGDILEFYLTSSGTIDRVNLVVKYTKS